MTAPRSEAPAAGLPWDRPAPAARRRGRGALGLLRTIVAAVLALCAGLAAVMAVTTTWIDDTVMDREGFSALSEDLLADQQLRDEIEAMALDSASQAVQDTDTGDIPMGGMITGWVDRRVGSTLVEYFDGDDYPQDMREVLEGTYDANVAAAEGPNGAPEDLQVDVAPVLDGLSGSISDRLPFGLEIDLSAMDLPGIDGGVAEIPDSATGPALDQLAEVSQQAPYWWIAAGVAAVLALVIARHREWMLLGAGLGLIGGVIAAGMVLQGFAETTMASPDLEGVGRTVVDRMFAALDAALNQRLGPWLWAGVALAGAGVVLGGVRLTWRLGGDDDSNGDSTTGLSRRGRRVIEA